MSEPAATSVYAAAFICHTATVQRAFVVASRRIAARNEPIHQAIVAGFRYDGPHFCHIVILLYREDGSETRYSMRIPATDIDAVSDSDIEFWEAVLAQTRYEQDIAAYIRVMGFDDDLSYL